MKIFRWFFLWKFRKIWTLLIASFSFRNTNNILKEIHNKQQNIAAPQVHHCDASIHLTNSIPWPVHHVKRVTNKYGVSPSRRRVYYSHRVKAALHIAQSSVGNIYSNALAQSTYSTRVLVHIFVIHLEIAWTHVIFLCVLHVFKYPASYAVCFPTAHSICMSPKLLNKIQPFLCNSPVSRISPKNRDKY